MVVLELLKGNSVNLSVLEKEDIQSSIAEWNNNSEFYGEYAPLTQDSQIEMAKLFETIENKKMVYYREKRWKQDWFNRLFSQRRLFGDRLCAIAK